MLTEIKSGNIELEELVVYSLSRFARNEQKRLFSDDLISKSGLAFQSVTETFPEDPDLAHLVKSLLGTVNEHQSRQNSKVVSDRKAEAVEKGYFTGGAIPFGYASIPAPDSEKGKMILAINPDQVEIVKEIFRLSLEGV